MLRRFPKGIIKVIEMENGHLFVPQHLIYTYICTKAKYWSVGEILDCCLLDFIFIFMEKLKKFRKVGNKMDSGFQRIAVFLLKYLFIYFLFALQELFIAHHSIVD